MSVVRRANPNRLSTSGLVVRQAHHDKPNTASVPPERTRKPAGSALYGCSGAYSAVPCSKVARRMPEGPCAPG